MIGKITLLIIARRRCFEYLDWKCIGKSRLYERVNRTWFASIRVAINA